MFDYLLEKQPVNMEGFNRLALKALGDISSNVVHRIPSKTKSNYHLLDLGSKKINVRPINTNLFIEDKKEFESSSHDVIKLLHGLSTARCLTEKIKKEYENILKEQKLDKVFYTIQQSISIGFDASLPGNQARKRVGINFENLMKSAFTELKINNKKLIFSIPVDSVKYSMDIDCVINPKTIISTTNKKFNPKDTAVSLKTSSKDRMSKIFIDKLLLKAYTTKKIKIIAIFHNDVQRKGKDKINSTFVPNIFLVYAKYLTPLDGVYYLDPPPQINKSLWKGKIFTVSKLFLEDVWTL